MTIGRSTPDTFGVLRKLLGTRGNGVAGDPIETAFGVLERDFGVKFDRARRSFVAEQASQQVADALGVSVGAPILVMRSVSFDDAGRAVERFAGFHRGDLSRLDVEVQHRQS